MADPNNPVGDEVSLEPNGTVRISLAGRPYRWRRPAFGEFRKLEELWAEVASKERTIVEAANAVPEKERPASWRIDFEGELGRNIVDWALDAWRLLCDKEPPSQDEMPPWMGNAMFHQSLKEQWVTVPLAASSR